MARELSQESLLDFLCQAGGRVTNLALLTHFKSFLRDPDASPGQHKQRRELFKGFVNSVAAVRQDPDGTKYVVLKRRYRDLLGEERLLRPRDPPAAAVPARGAAPSSPRGARRQQSQPQPRRRRDQEREEEPAGAAARVTDAGCNGLPAKDAREAVPEGGGQRVSSDQTAPALAPAVAAQAGVRCAAVETQGQCCWECLQNSVEGLPGESHLDALPNSATAKEKSALALPAQDDRGAPKERLEGVPAEPEHKPTQEPAVTPTPPPATVEPALSRVSLPTLLPHPPPTGDRLELLAPCTQQYSTQQQQQLRTLEWVARHPQVPEAQDQSPTRTWSVLPDNFLQLSTETNSAPPTGPPLSSHALFPVVPDESSEPGSGNPPLTVFRSIRCQLSLQDLYDFVDQESHGSEESSSAPKESPGGSEDGLQIAVGTPDWGKRRSPDGGISVSPEERSPSKSPQDLRNRGVGLTTQQAPAGANGLAGHPQEPLPWPTPKLRRSLRRSSRAGRAKLSSSDEEVLDEDLLKRSRCPPRPSSRKSSKAGAVPSPRVDAALTPKLSNKTVVTEGGWALSSWELYREGPSALDMHRHEHKSSLVPLEAREHEWIVKLASGSWFQVLTLFCEDPQLALHKDFLTGYTALHWMAKHGNLRALEDLVSGAQKSGIVLDVNVKSGCGYTPLHLAAIHGHQGVIKWLVQRLSSRVNIRDSSGKKPWQYLTSNTSGEIWQLLGAPRGKPIFPVSPLVGSSSPTRKAKIREISRSVTRKTSFAALLRSHHNKRKFANQYEKFPTSREREEYSD